jgi:HEAT repeat protein
VHQLRAATSDAVAALRDALNDDNTGHRIRAAAILLEVVVKVNLDDLTRRVEALEAAQPPAPYTRPAPRIHVEHRDGPAPSG